jgi:hypothetical protein
MEYLFMIFVKYHPMELLFIFQQNLFWETVEPNGKTKKISMKESII